jgi:hypothetical protein
VTSPPESLRTSGSNGGLDCVDFGSRSEAQAYLDAHPWDPYYLNGDGNGIACEWWTYMSSEVWLRIATLMFGIVLRYFADWMREKRTPPLVVLTITRLSQPWDDKREPGSVSTRALCLTRLAG